MKHPVLLFLYKVTAYPLKLLFFKNKTYFEDRHVQKKRIKGGALIVSNHPSVMDYINYFFLFFFRKVHPLVAEFNYKHFLMRVRLNTVGAIKVDRNTKDLSFVDKTVDLLKKDKVCLIFPEGRTNDEKKELLQKLSHAYVLMALRSKKPIIPVFTDGNFHLFKRNHTIIGKPIYLHELVFSDTPNKEELLNLGKIVEDKLIELGHELEKRKRSKIFDFKKIPMDFGRLFFYFHLNILFRCKFYCLEHKKAFKRDGHFIIATNHNNFYDPIFMMCAFWRRRMYYLTAKEVFGLPKHKLRAKALKDIGCVSIDRSINDFDAINKSIELLNNGKILTIYPEGAIKKGNNEISPVKFGVGLIASKSNSPIIPVYRKVEKKWYQRQKFYVGRAIYPNKGSSMSAIKEYAAELEKQLVELKELSGDKHE